MALVEEELSKNPKEEIGKIEKTFRQNFIFIKDNITVEPVLAGYIISGMLARLATQNLSLEKACRVNKKYEDTVCDALIVRQGNLYLKEELAVQELIAAMESWKNILLTAIPSFLILFLGAWSDRTGKRKICILLPIFGDLLMCLSNILNVYYFYELPVEITMFFEALFPAITGTWVTIFMGAFAYTSDVSSKESRTFRLGILSLCLTVGELVGSVLSGLLLKHIGYYGVFSLSSLLYIFSIVYGFYYIEDSKRSEILEKKPTGVFRFLKSFFDVKHVKDTLTVAFKKGPNHRQKKSILVLILIAFVDGPYSGESTVHYLFTRYRFNWDALKFSLYSTFYISIYSLGALISISLFSHRLGWDDSMLGLISSFSKIIGSLATSFARNTTEMYIAGAAKMFSATSIIVLRSTSSKLCASDELGKMTSFFNLMEVLTSMTFAPIYSWIYMITLKIDASIVFYISTVLTLPCFTIFGWFFLQHRRSRSYKTDDHTNPEENEQLNEIK